MEDDDWGSYPIVNSIPVRPKQTSRVLPYDPFIFDLSLVPIKWRFSKDSGQEYPIKSGSVLGKNGKDINIEYPNVSRNHCRFEEGMIQDLGSTSGTFIAMTQKLGRVVEAGDIYQMGKCEIRIASWTKGGKLQYSLNHAPDQLIRMKEDRILIGSSITCDIVHPSLDEIHGEISSSGVIKHYQMDDHLDFDKGIWLRLSQKGKQSRRYPLPQSTILKMDPIMFKLMY